MKLCARHEQGRRIVHRSMMARCGISPNRKVWHAQFRYRVSVINAQQAPPGAWERLGLPVIVDPAFMGGVRKELICTCWRENDPAED